MKGISGGPNSSEIEKGTYAQSANERVVSIREGLIEYLKTRNNDILPSDLEKLDILSLFHLFDILKNDEEICNDLDFTDVEQKNKAIFLVRDRIFRYFFHNKDSQVLKSLEDQNLPNCGALFRQIERILGNKNFLQTMNRTNVAASSFFQNLRYERGGEQSENKEAPTRVLHATVEYKGKSRAGGVGTVVEQMSIGQAGSSKTQPGVITGFYGFWKTDYLDNAEFKGCVKFPYKGEVVCCSIYKSITPEGVEQFLIEPDPKHVGLFDLGTGQGVYSSTANSPTMDRLAYTSGAIAAFSSSYQGEDGRERFDVVQSHNPALGGFIAALLSQYNNSLLESKHKEVAPIILGHGAAPGDEVPVERRTLEDLSLKVPFFVSKVPLLGLAYTWSWHSVWVSETRKKEALSKDSVLGLHKICRHIEKNDRFHAVTNGCDPRSFSITSSEAYGADALRGPERDYMTAKKEMRKRLYEQGLISSPDKPLFLWVGRIDPYIKGVDILLSMVEEIHKKGGQCVIMGFPIDSNHRTPEVEALKKFAEEHPETLKVYDKKTDQLDTFNNSPYNKGKALRYAADVMLLPSRSEGAPMVVQELFSVGAILCCSNAGGIPDYAHDYEGSEDYNAFMFQCDLKSRKKMEENARKAVAQTFEKYLCLSSAERNRLMDKWVKEVDERWCWNGPRGPLEKYEKVYEQAKKEAAERLKDPASKKFECEENEKVFVKSIRFTWKNLFASIRHIFYVIASFFRQFRMKLQRQSLLSRSKKSESQGTGMI